MQKFLSFFGTLVKKIKEKLVKNQYRKNKILRYGIALKVINYEKLLAIN